MSYLSEELQKKWAPLLENADLPKIGDSHKKAVTAQLLENMENSLREQNGTPGMLSEAGPTNATGTGINNFDPVLISLVRRSMPNLVAYDVCGVQPMTGPSSLIFAMRSRYDGQAGAESFYTEVDTGTLLAVVLIQQQLQQVILHRLTLVVKHRT